jgi:hypothetical protein
MTEIAPVVASRFLAVSESAGQQFRGGASGLKERGLPTERRKHDASRPERKPTTLPQATDRCRSFSPALINHQAHI